jgi:hypothetical protein
MLSVGHAGPISTGNTQENADDLPSTMSRGRKRRRASRLCCEAGTGRGDQEGVYLPRTLRHKKPRAGRDSVMRFIVRNAHALAILLAGFRATHVTWERVAPPAWKQ